MKNKNNKNKNGAMIVVLVIVALSTLGLGSIFSQPQAPQQQPANTVVSDRQITRKLALDCTLDFFTAYHIHPHLKIIINGAVQTIPANIGITVDCMHPIHTHDTTGEIHVESPAQRDFILDDFFAVWNKPFSSDGIFDYKVDAGHKLTMTVDGQPNNEYENLVLRDGQQIVIEYKGK